jgi:hypothetical protein
VLKLLKLFPRKTPAGTGFFVGIQALPEYTLLSPANAGAEITAVNIRVPARVTIALVLFIFCPWVVRYFSINELTSRAISFDNSVISED